MPPFTPLFIDGKPVSASDGNTFEIRNPFSNEVVGISASASSEDCQNAIIAAGKAFETWERTSVDDRCDIFLKASALIKLDKYKDKILKAVVEETASAPGFAKSSAASSAILLHDVGMLASELEGRSLASRRIKGATVTIERKAMGVILAISPWNAPIVLTLRAILIPILCGNTVVFRSSENSPRSQAIVYELLQEAGLPAGVFNFISTSRETAPQLTAQIIAHPLIRKFTGSDRAGRAIAIEAAKNLKPCVLELGGKAPVIVLDDANINEAAKAIVQAGFLHTGQICMSTERVIIQRGVFEELRDKICKLAGTLKAGNGQDTKLGPLFAESSAESVISMIKEAKEAGASVLLGDVSRDGVLVQPHVLTDIKPGMRLWDRESFGPVLVLIAFDSIDEGVALANASDYSLTAGLWTSDLYLAKDVSSRIHSGYVNVNGQTIGSESLYGLRGLGGSSGYGRFSVDEFIHERVVVTHPLGASHSLFD